MSTVAILGAGAGGLSATVELSAAGHRVHLWNRSAGSLATRLPDGLLRYAGVLGTATMRPDLVTTDLGEALAGADAAVICLPAAVHEAVFTALAELAASVPLVLVPGHTGGALHARTVFARAGVALPPIAELSTLTYVARIDPDGLLRTTGKARQVRGAALPGGEEALDAAAALFPQVDRVRNVLITSLSDVNLVLHPPGAVLAAAWVEATGGGFTFYRDAMTPGVGRVLARLDQERLAVAEAYGFPICSLLDEMTAIGTAEPAVDIAAAIRAGEANSLIPGPDSFAHRYYREDIPFGLVPLLALAKLAGVDMPVARSLCQLAYTAVADLPPGRTATVLGIRGIGVPGVLDLVGATPKPVW